MLSKGMLLPSWETGKPQEVQMAKPLMRYPGHFTKRLAR